MPETALLTIVAAENSRPSERRPVSSRIWSVTSATIDTARMPPATVVIMLKANCPISSHSSSGSPLAGNRPARRRISGTTLDISDRPNMSIAAGFLPKRADSGSTTTKASRMPATAVDATVAI